MSSIPQELARIARRMADLERRLENSVRHGAVKEVDAERQRVRLAIGKGPDGTEQLSPWIPYAQQAGALKVHTPPSVGQNMTAFSPGGDLEQAMALPMTWNDGNASPSSSADENVMTFGDSKVEIRGDEIVVTVPRLFIKCGGTTLELTEGGLKAVAADYQWD